MPIHKSLPHWSNNKFLSNAEFLNKYITIPEKARFFYYLGTTRIDLFNLQILFIYSRNRYGCQQNHSRPEWIRICYGCDEDVRHPSLETH